MMKTPLLIFFILLTNLSFGQINLRSLGPNNPSNLEVPSAAVTAELATANARPTSQWQIGDEIIGPSTMNEYKWNGVTFVYVGNINGTPVPTPSGSGPITASAGPITFTTAANVPVTTGFNSPLTMNGTINMNGYTISNGGGANTAGYFQTGNGDGSGLELGNGGFKLFYPGGDDPYAIWMEGYWESPSLPLALDAFGRFYGSHQNIQPSSNWLAQGTFIPGTSWGNMDAGIRVQSLGASTTFMADEFQGVTGAGVTLFHVDADGTLDSPGPAPVTWSVAVTQIVTRGNLIYSINKTPVPEP